MSDNEAHSDAAQSDRAPSPMSQGVPNVDEQQQQQPAEEQQVNEPVVPLGDIFQDSDSDLSELEDEDGGSPAPEVRPAQSRSPSAARSRSPSATRSPSPGQADGNDDGDDGEGDDYQDTAEKSVKKLGKIKRKPRAAADGDGGEREPPKKKKKTKKSREVVEDEEEAPVDENTRRRRELNSRLDEIIKPKKKTGGKQKGGPQDDDLELLNDEAVARLRSDMFHAADKDTDENREGRPAVFKLRMLPQVVEMMQKTALAESLVENGILEAVKKWLEPLPDRSLPALNIQRPLFEILRTLSIETSALKSSGLGKIVYFYTKCKRVEPYIARMANQLVSDWMRPIIRRSKAFVDKDVSAAANTTRAYEDYRPRASQGKLLNKNVAKRQQAEGSQGSGGGAVARRHARIPAQLTQSFKIAPIADAGEREARMGGDAGRNPQQQSQSGGGTKMREYKRKLVAAQSSSRRV